MSNFLGWFFHVLGGKKNLKNEIVFTYIFLLLLKKFEKVEKTGFFRANTQILKSECTT